MSMSDDDILNDERFEVIPVFPKTPENPRKKPVKKSKRKKVSRATKRRKSAKKSTINVKIHIDVREPNYEKTIHALTVRGWDTEINMLDVGDFLIEAENGEYVVIERKRADDLFRSLIDGRLDLQINDLSFHEHALIAIVGDAFRPEASECMKHGEFPQRVISVLASVALRVPAGGWKPSLVFLRSENDLIYLIDYVARLLENNRLYREEPPTTIRTLYAPQKSMSLKDPRLVRVVRSRMLSSIPTIGRKTANQVLNHFDNSFEKLFHATLDELEKVNGIGKKRAMLIWNFLHS